MAEFNVFQIPFSNTPQSFNISLRGRLLTLVNRWNFIDSTWRVDISDAITFEDLILSIPLVTGINLLHQYKFVGLDGQIIVFTNSNIAAPPTYENLGVDSNVYFMVEK